MQNLSRVTFGGASPFKNTCVNSMELDVELLMGGGGVYVGHAWSMFPQKQNEK